MTVAEGGGKRAVLRKFQDVYLPAMKAMYIVWPAVQLINFRIMPLPLQLVHPQPVPAFLDDLIADWPPSPWCRRLASRGPPTSPSRMQPTRHDILVHVRVGQSDSRTGGGSWRLLVGPFAAWGTRELAVVVLLPFPSTRRLRLDWARRWLDLAFSSVLASGVSASLRPGRPL